MENVIDFNKAKPKETTHAECVKDYLLENLSPIRADLSDCETTFLTVCLPLDKQGESVPLIIGDVYTDQEHDLIDTLQEYVDYLKSLQPLHGDPSNDN